MGIKGFARGGVARVIFLHILPHYYSFKMVYSLPLPREAPAPVWQTPSRQGAACAQKSCDVTKILTYEYTHVLPAHARMRVLLAHIGRGARMRRARACLCTCAWHVQRTYIATERDTCYENQLTNI